MGHSRWKKKGSASGQDTLSENRFLTLSQMQARSEGSRRGQLGRGLLKKKKGLGENGCMLLPGRETFYIGSTEWGVLGK